VAYGGGEIDAVIARSFERADVGGKALGARPWHGQVGSPPDLPRVDRDRVTEHNGCALTSFPSGLRPHPLHRRPNRLRADADLKVADLRAGYRQHQRRRVAEVLEKLNR